MDAVVDEALAEQQKTEALRILERLDIFGSYIEGFRKENKVCFFERFGGFWVYQEREIEAKMKEIEKEYGCKVYAITHEFIGGDEHWSFLIVTNYKDEWSDLVFKDGNGFYAFAYTWNKSYPDCSEFGDIYVQSAYGGLRRIG